MKLKWSPVEPKAPAACPPIGCCQVPLRNRQHSMIGHAARECGCLMRCRDQNERAHLLKNKLKHKKRNTRLRNNENKKQKHKQNYNDDISKHTQFLQFDRVFQKRRFGGTQQTLITEQCVHGNMVCLGREFQTRTRGVISQPGGGAGCEMTPRQGPITRSGVEQVCRRLNSGCGSALGKLAPHIDSSASPTLFF